MKKRDKLLQDILSFRYKVGRVRIDKYNIDHWTFLNYCRFSEGAGELITKTVLRQYVKDLPGWIKIQFLYDVWANIQQSDGFLEVQMRFLKELIEVFARFDLVFQKVQTRYLYKYIDWQWDLYSKKKEILAWEADAIAFKRDKKKNVKIRIQKNEFMQDEYSFLNSIFGSNTWQFTASDMWNNVIQKYLYSPKRVNIIPAQRNVKWFYFLWNVFKFKRSWRKKAGNKSRFFKKKSHWVLRYLLRRGYRRAVPSHKENVLHLRELQRVRSEVLEVLKNGIGDLEDSDVGVESIQKDLKTSFNNQLLAFIARKKLKKYYHKTCKLYYQKMVWPKFIELFWKNCLKKFKPVTRNITWRMFKCNLINQSLGYLKKSFELKLKKGKDFLNKEIDKVRQICMGKVKIFDTWSEEDAFKFLWTARTKFEMHAGVRSMFRYRKFWHINWAEKYYWPTVPTGIVYVKRTLSNWFLYFLDWDYKIVTQFTGGEYANTNRKREKLNPQIVGDMYKYGLKKWLRKYGIKRVWILFEGRLSLSFTRLRYSVMKSRIKMFNAYILSKLPHNAGMRRVKPRRK